MANAHEEDIRVHIDNTIAILEAQLSQERASAQLGFHTAIETPATASLRAASPSPHQAVHFEPNPLVLRAISRSILSSDDGALSELGEGEARTEDSQAEEGTNPALREVYWTAPAETSADLLAANWGVGALLFKLNPELAPGSKVAEGTRLKVYTADPEAPTGSVGHPNRGRLQNGLPLPEGESWRLRPNRRRAFGTHRTISTLVSAFEAYGERFPGATPVRVGEIAKRRGGRASPHASHRTGRDVDLGYIGVAEDDGEVRWQRMGEDSLDAEKNWFLIYEMIKTGNVDTIFISSRLQPLLYRAAKAQGLADEELRRIFQHPRHPDSPRAIIKHWRGHVNHMHVRFRCEDWNSRCRGDRKGHDDEPEIGAEIDVGETVASATTAVVGAG